MSEVKQLQTLEEATRYAYGLKETIKELDEYKRIAEMEIQKWEEKIKEVNTWLEDVSKPINERINYFQILLVDYHRRTFLEANEKEQNLIENLIPSPSLFSAYILWGWSTDIKENIKYLNNLFLSKHH